MGDRDDDMKNGVLATAIAFGAMDRMLVGVMQLMVLGGLALIGYALILQWPFWLALGGAGALFAYQQWLMRDRGREGCFKAFLNNNWVGLLVLAGIIAG